MKTRCLKKFLGFALAIIILLNNTYFVKAAINNDSLKSQYCNEDVFGENGESFENMTVEELNDYINKQKEILESQHTQLIGINTSVSLAKSSTNSIKNAWLAAAEIARKKGYPCAATLVKCSVNNTAYNESSIAGGMFGKKIKKINVYKNTMKSFKKGKKTSKTGSFTITKSSNADLYYVLHKVNYNFKGKNVKSALSTYEATITDTFDFAYDNNYDSLFTNCVNNWAWLCQQTKVLHKIKVKIFFVA